LGDIICYSADGEVLQYFTQWDVNQKLIIKGADISSSPVFHFLNANIDVAYTVQSTLDGESIITNVPDILLQYDVPLIVFVEYEYGTTEYSIRIPIMPRARPSDYIITDGSGSGPGSGSGSQSSIAVINNLTTLNAFAALSAMQGYVLDQKIKDIEETQIDESDIEDAVNNAVSEAIENLEIPTEPGRGIVSVDMTSGDGSPGSIDIYTITYTDGTTSTFSVYNGADGTSGTSGPIDGGIDFVVQDVPPEDTSILWVDLTDNSDGGFQEAVNTVLAQAKASGEFDGENYILTYADKNEIALLAAELVDPPSSGGNTVPMYYTTEEPTFDVSFLFEATLIETNGKTINLGDWIVTPSGKVYVVDFIYSAGVEATYDPNLDSGSNSIENGATFIPYIDEDGILTWRNDKGLINPAPIRVVPIRGVDYWTEDDIQEIKSYVEDSILGGTW
jgi:hypothetical protein